jgi:hypothetical protein
LDAEGLFARSSRDGIPGDELFYEHVHLTPAGNYLLARATADLAAGMMAGGGRPGLVTNAIAWLSEAECGQRLGLTDWGRFDALQLVQRLLGEPPFTTQTVHSNQMQKVRAELSRLRVARRPSGIQKAMGTVQAAVDRDPSDTELLRILASVLEASGAARSAEQRWREVTRLLPQAPIPYLNLAQLLGGQGRGRAGL